jgi:hypothetical protein
MHAMPVDPRISRWEVDQPTYQVYFWQPSSNVPDAMWTSDEWRLTEADVHEVLAWTQDQARGRRITVWVELVRDGQPAWFELADGSRLAPTLHRRGLTSRRCAQETRTSAVERAHARSR